MSETCNILGILGSLRRESYNVYPVNEPEVMITHAADKFDGEGTLTDARTRENIRELLQNLVDWTRRLRDRRDLPFASPGALAMPPSEVGRAPVHA